MWLIEKQNFYWNKYPLTIFGFSELMLETVSCRISCKNIRFISGKYIFFSPENLWRRTLEDNSFLTNYQSWVDSISISWLHLPERKVYASQFIHYEWETSKPKVWRWKVMLRVASSIFYQIFFFLGGLLQHSSADFQQKSIFLLRAGKIFFLN